VTTGKRAACVAAFAVMLLSGAVANAQVLDEAAPPGSNYDKAEFRLWTPPASTAPFKAVLILVPGSNGDGRPAVDDPVWQEFAKRLNLAIVACRFTDKPHDPSFIEEYVNVSQGSGQALINALASFAAKAGRPEIATAPLLLWGMSAGGQFNYEFVAWKPERVAAFVVNKGGIYYSALVPAAARRVPGMLFVGGKDLEFRTNTIVGLFAVNRRAGALWALAEEPGAAHVVGRSRDVALVFYEDVLAMKSVTATPGFLGDLKTKTFQPMPAAGAPNYPTAWLPTERVARAWRAMVADQPFDQ